MAFDPDAIERLSPEERVQVQDWIARRFLELRSPRKPERRRAMRRLYRKHDWPRQWDHDALDVAERQTRARGAVTSGARPVAGSGPPRGAPGPQARVSGAGR